MWPCPAPTAYVEEGVFLSAIYKGGDSRALHSVPQPGPPGMSPVKAERTWHTASAGLKSATVIIIIAVTVSMMC